MSCNTERHGSQLKTPSTIGVKQHRQNSDLMKAGILLSSVAAACTASMGIAVWKLVLDRPSSDTQSGITTAVNNDESTDLPTETTANDPEFSTSKLDNAEDSTDWKVGDSRASLLWTIANKVPSSTKKEDPDWDSDSDTTEWSSVTDDDEYRQPVDARSRSWKSMRQRSSRWVHVGYGRYTKCA